MNGLALLICASIAAAHGQGPTEGDRRTLADMGLKMVRGQLVDIRTPTPSHVRTGRPGIRQGGPECYWYLADGLGYIPNYVEPLEPDYALAPVGTSLMGFTPMGFIPGSSAFGAGLPLSPFGYYPASYAVPEPIPQVIEMDGTEKTTSTSVFESDKNYTPVIVTDTSNNPVAVDEPSSLYLLGSAILVFLFMGAVKRQHTKSI